MSSTDIRLTLELSPQGIAALGERVFKMSNTPHRFGNISFVSHGAGMCSLSYEHRNTDKKTAESYAAHEFTNWLWSKGFRVLNQFLLVDGKPSR